MKVNKINMGVFVKFVNFDLQFAQILKIRYLQMTY
jgi:hypothetical protein